jgi:WD40 repeat protein
MGGTLFDETIKLDVITGHNGGDPFKGHQNVLLSVEFSPNGRHISSGSADKIIRLWDAQMPSVLYLAPHTPGGI